MKVKKKFVPNKNTRTPLKSRLQKSGIINLERVPSLLNQASTESNDL